MLCPLNELIVRLFTFQAFSPTNAITPGNYPTLQYVVLEKSIKTTTPTLIFITHEDERISVCIPVKIPLKVLIIIILFTI